MEMMDLSIQLISLVCHFWYCSIEKCSFYDDISGILIKILAFSFECYAVIQFLLNILISNACRGYYIFNHATLNNFGCTL